MGGGTQDEGSSRWGEPKIRGAQDGEGDPKMRGAQDEGSSRWGEPKMRGAQDGESPR